MEAWSYFLDKIGLHLSRKRSVVVCGCSVLLIILAICVRSYCILGPLLG